MSENYNEDSIRSLDWKEHIRLRPGMYIGKMGNGSSPDDGIYILLKEVIDNSECKKSECELNVKMDEYIDKMAAAININKRS